MSDDVRQYNEYVTHVYNKLETSGHDKEEIENIVKKIDSKYNDMNYAFPRKGWKYLVSHFTPEIKRGKNVYFLNLYERNVMSIKNEDGTYTVTFSFLNEKETDVNKDYKKYLIYNYFMDRYTYRNIKSTSYLNSIVVANNKNYKDFPKCKRIHMSPYLALMDNVNYPYLFTPPEETRDSYFHDCYNKYIRIREELKDKNGIVDKDIRFYFLNTFGILVTRNSETSYDVTFSFINPKDYYYLDNLNNRGDVKHIMRYCMIKNKLINKYTYTVNDVCSSLNAAVNAYNKNRLQFPSYYHNVKMTVFIEQLLNDK